MSILGTEAEIRAYNSWESARLSPPDYDDSSWVEEIQTCYVNKKVVGGCSYEYDVTRDQGCPSATTEAYKLWLNTKRGRLLYEVFLELHGPFRVENHYLKTEGSRRGEKVWMAYTGETADDYVAFRYPLKEQDIQKKAMKWIEEQGLIKVNTYWYETEQGYGRTTVSIGGVKVTNSTKPIPEPEYDPY
jgi:hypothetical protein